MIRLVSGILLLWPLWCADLAVAAKANRSKRIDIQYVAPKSPDHQRMYQLLKADRALERIQTLLSPLRLPRRLLLKIEGCDGVSNAWYDGESVTVCYEYLDDVWKNAPQETTPEGVTPVDALIGPFIDVFLHEVGHAVFDILDIPVLGREEDAADYFSVYIMLKFEKSEARRLIFGSAYVYKDDLKSPQVTVPLREFADVHGTPSQRFFNVLCIAYGADRDLFADLVKSGALPQKRADSCEDEFLKLDASFKRLMGPFVDRRLARRVHKNWLPPIDTRPQQRSTAVNTP